MAKITSGFEEICAQLDQLLLAKFTFLRTEPPAQMTAGLERDEQDYILNWVRRSGIDQYCITIDKEARDYLSHKYGTAGFTVIDG